MTWIVTRGFGFGMKVSFIDTSMRDVKMQPEGGENEHQSYSQRASA
jgi:hypothetical protein